MAQRTARFLGGVGAAVLLSLTAGAGVANADTGATRTDAGTPRAACAPAPDGEICLSGDGANTLIVTFKKTAGPAFVRAEVGYQADDQDFAYDENPRDVNAGGKISTTFDVRGGHCYTGLVRNPDTSFQGARLCI